MDGPQDDATSQAVKERMKKVMLRPQNSMQIDLRDKKPVGKKSVKMSKAKTPKRRGASATKAKGKTPVKRRPMGVRRNLSFDDGSGVFDSPSKKKVRPTACTPKKGAKTPKKTPKKQQKSASKFIFFKDNS